tara:strand:- start:6885 stop:7502 length:618 start_codon:yes stop_codon:yes gene_type:complete
VELEHWKKRIGDRTDLTTRLVHLTKGAGGDDCIDVLVKILSCKKLNGSTTQSGFIIGSTPAVCFQDAPVYSVFQNIWFEQKSRELDPKRKRRYSPVGIMLEKQAVFAKGGRPVIYDESHKAKKYLPKSEWWRIVGFDLANDHRIIDWTHEREWRIPHSISFELEDVCLLFANIQSIKLFEERCKKNGVEHHLKVGGMIPVDNIAF